MQKHVNLVDLVKSFPRNIFLQKSASIQPRTSQPAENALLKVHLIFKLWDLIFYRVAPPSSCSLGKDGKDELATHSVIIVATSFYQFCYSKRFKLSPINPTYSPREGLSPNVGLQSDRKNYPTPALFNRPRGVRSRQEAAKILEGSFSAVSTPIFASQQ